MATRKTNRVGWVRFTPEMRADILEMAKNGLTHFEIASIYGTSRSSIGGVIHRASHGYIYKRDQPQAERTKIAGWHVPNPNLMPAKYPFAADESCPDFAHDDMHCEAVLAHGGYPTLIFRKAA